LKDAKKKIVILEEKVKVADELVEHYDTMQKDAKAKKNKNWKRASSKV